jgi:CDP-diacylglycerol--serine O-phosphatidyltransferase
MKHVPNFITSLNLASGFISIIFILNGDINTASWLVLLAMVFDFLDGFSARLLKAYSDLGKELDSLADVVSFGVAPGLIIYHLLLQSLESPDKAGLCFSVYPSLIFITISAIMPVCAALRLAIFNTDTTQTTSFKGLPTPASALAVISFVIGAHYSGSAFLISLVASPIFLIILSLSLSVLMVTRIPLLSLKFKSFKIKGNEGRYALIVLCTIMILAFGIASIPGIIPIYIIVSTLSLLFSAESK